MYSELVKKGKKIVTTYIIYIHCALATSNMKKRKAKKTIAIHLSPLYYDVHKSVAVRLFNITNKIRELFKQISK